MKSSLCLIFMVGCVTSTEMEGCSYDQSAFTGSSGLLEFTSDLCSSNGLFSEDCWIPEEPIATGSVWTVVSGGEGSPTPVISVADPSIVEVEITGPDSAILTALAAGETVVSWSHGAATDTFSVEIRDPAEVSLRDGIVDFDSWLINMYDEQHVVHGTLPEPPGDHLLIFEDNDQPVWMDALRDEDGEYLHFPDDGFQVDGVELEGTFSLNALESSIVSLGEHPLLLPELSSASEEAIASMELVVLHNSIFTIAQVIARDSSGERIWAPTVTWGVQERSRATAERSVYNGALGLYWDSESIEGVEEVSVELTATTEGGHRVSATVVLGFE